MKRLLLVMMLVAGSAGGARAAVDVPAAVTPAAVAPRTLAAKEVVAPIGPTTFRVQAWRLPDGWLEAHRGDGYTARELVLGAVLGLGLLVTLGTLAVSLMLLVKPRGLTGRGLTRRRSEEMLAGS